MSDLISRSLLIEKLQKWKFANEERGYDTAKDLVQEMIDLTKEQPTVTNKDFEILLGCMKDAYPQSKAGYKDFDVFLRIVMLKFASEIEKRELHES